MGGWLHGSGVESASVAFCGATCSEEGPGISVAVAKLKRCAIM